MAVISYTSLRQNLRGIMDAIVSDRITYEVVRKGQEPVVMLSKQDFDAMNETLYLLSSQENARRLHESVQQEEDGELTSMDDM